MASGRVIQIAHPDTGDDEWQALRAPLVNGWLTQGPKVAAFEKAFAARHEALVFEEDRQHGSDVAVVLDEQNGRAVEIKPIGRTGRLRGR